MTERDAGQTGFSLVELTIVIVLVALLAVFVGPRLQSARFDALRFQEEALAAIRYAHKIAITSGCAVRVEVAASQVRLRYAGSPASCGTGALVNPATGNPFEVDAPSSLVVAGVTFEYDRIGDPDTAQTIVMTHPDAGTRSIVVTDETGFAYTP